MFIIYENMSPYLVFFRVALRCVQAEQFFGLTFSSCLQHCSSQRPWLELYVKKGEEMLVHIDTESASGCTLRCILCNTPQTDLSVPCPYL